MSLFVAMVVLERPELPEAAALKAALSGFSVSKVDAQEHTLSFTLEGIDIVCGLVAAPIPPEELRPILRTSLFWRKDDAAILEHQAHLIVTAFGKVELKELALVLTQAVDGVLKSTGGSIAVYWGGGATVTQKDIFCEFADEATLEHLPLYLWIDFRCYPERGGCALFTQGLKGLGLMEIEVSYSSLSSDETVGLVFNIAHYLLDQGPVLKDGDTIGMSAEQKLKVTHVPSAHARKETVYHLEIN